MYKEITGVELDCMIKGYNQAIKDIMDFCEESIKIYEGDSLFEYTEEEKQVFRLIYQVCKSKIKKL